MELVSPQTSGSKRPSEPSMELANPRNDVASAPQPPKAVKVYIHKLKKHIYLLIYVVIN